MASVMILAAGFGTRLRPLTDELPKALLPVGDRPLLAHLGARLRAAGYRDAVINTHHRAGDFISVLSGLGINIAESFEPEILGTAGGIAQARGRLTAPILVHNADIQCELPFERLRLMARAGGIYLAVTPRACGQGSVGIGDAGQVVRLRGEQFGHELQGGDYVGVAALGADCLSELPANGCLIGDYCLPRLRQGRTVGALCEDVRWSDVGTLQGYVEANFAWLSAGANASSDSYLAADAIVAPGVELRRSLVGAGAHVSGSGQLVQCVVWPGARVVAPLERAVVTPSQVLHFTVSDPAES